MNEDKLDHYLESYYNSFFKKAHTPDNFSTLHDVLMDVYGVTPKQKHESSQFWGRQLGALWQKLVSAVFEQSSLVQNYTGPIRITDNDGKLDEPADLSGNGYAIDTKYRIGSGDAKFIKQTEKNAAILNSMNLKPVLLILRIDSLANPIRAAKSAGWQILEGIDSFDFIKEQTGYDLYNYLDSKKQQLNIDK